jgi:uncharacterized protein YlxW (UPF0749 family)
MRGGAPRLAVPLAAALLGFMAVVAASQPQQPLRETRRLELVDLIEQEDARVERLAAQVARLEGELDQLGSGTGQLSGLARRVEELQAAAGEGALEGPGIVVRLDDSGEVRSATGDPNDLLVHERDIQVVVNALWSAGAEAVAINGQRLTSLSAVRCAGNTLLLHGTVHSPPYLISAIGDPAALAAALPAEPGFARLLRAAESFGIQLAVEAGQVEMRAEAVSRPGVASVVGEG